MDCDHIVQKQQVEVDTKHDVMATCTLKATRIVVNRVPTHLENLENSWNFILDLEFWYYKSIYAGFDTVTAVSRTS